MRRPRLALVPLALFAAVAVPAASCRRPVVDEEPPPGRAAAKAPTEPLPERNLVANGGFEILGPDSFAFPAGWHRWTEGGRQAAVRLEGSDAHTGDRSIWVKVFAEGVSAGAWTTLLEDMPPGRYEVRFWGCAELKTAEVSVRLAGEEMLKATVGEDWTRITRQVDLAGKRARPVLHVLVTSPRGWKVWIDDVELRAVPRR